MGFWSWVWWGCIKVMLPAYGMLAVILLLYCYDSRWFNPVDGFPARPIIYKRYHGTFGEYQVRAYKLLCWLVFLDTIICIGVPFTLVRVAATTLRLVLQLTFTSLFILWRITTRAPSIAWALCCDLLILAARIIVHSTRSMWPVLGPIVGVAVFAYNILWGILKPLVVPLVIKLKSGGAAVVSYIMLRRKRDTRAHSGHNHSAKKHGKDKKQKPAMKQEQRGTDGRMSPDEDVIRGKSDNSDNSSIHSVGMPRNVVKVFGGLRGKINGCCITLRIGIQYGVSAAACSAVQACSFGMSIFMSPFHYMVGMFIYMARLSHSLSVQIRRLAVPKNVSCCGPQQAVMCDGSVNINTRRAHSEDSSSQQQHTRGDQLVAAEKRVQQLQAENARILSRHKQLEDQVRLFELQIKQYKSGAELSEAIQASLQSQLTASKQAEVRQNDYINDLLAKIASLEDQVGSLERKLTDKARQQSTAHEQAQHKISQQERIVRELVDHVEQLEQQLLHYHHRCAQQPVAFNKDAQHTSSPAAHRRSEEYDLERDRHAASAMPPAAAASAQAQRTGTNNKSRVGVRSRAKGTSGAASPSGSAGIDAARHLQRCQTVNVHAACPSSVDMPIVTSISTPSPSTPSYDAGTADGPSSLGSATVNSGDNPQHQQYMLPADHPWSDVSGLSRAGSDGSAGTYVSADPAAAAAAAAAFSYFAGAFKQQQPPNVHQVTGASIWQQAGSMYNIPTPQGHSMHSTAAHHAVRSVPVKAVLVTALSAPACAAVTAADAPEASEAISGGEVQELMHLLGADFD